MITITLPQYITYAGNLFKCMWKRATILQAKMKTFQGLTEIAMNQAYNNMQEFIEDCLTLEMETCMKYEGEFPHIPIGARLGYSLINIKLSLGNCTIE